MCFEDSNNMLRWHKKLAEIRGIDFSRKRKQLTIEDLSNL